MTIHSVITERGIGRIPEIVRFFGENFPGAAVQIEPNFPCGRGSVTNERFPSTTLFVKGLIEAFKVAETLGVDITYSGVNPQLDQARNRFCGITVPNFIVTPTGLVTACNEVAEMNSEILFSSDKFDEDSSIELSSNSSEQQKQSPIAPSHAQ